MLVVGLEIIKRGAGFVGEEVGEGGKMVLNSVEKELKMVSVVVEKDDGAGTDEVCR